jgi:hypothetical protein
VNHVLEVGHGDVVDGTGQQCRTLGAEVVVIVFDIGRPMLLGSFSSPGYASSCVVQLEHASIGKSLRERRILLGLFREFGGDVMIEIALAALIASAGVLPSAAAPLEPLVQEVQFRGSPGGGCPDGFAFNYSDGRCYPNGRQPPGEYAQPEYQPRRGCPDGFAFNYSDGRCYRNGRQQPGEYAQPEYQPRRGCPDGFAFNYSDNHCYRNGRQPPGVYAR